LYLLDCNTPPTLEGTDVSYTNTTYQSEAEYSCIIGYTYVSGTSTSACQADGNWDVVVYICAVTGVSICTIQPGFSYFEG